MGNAIIGMVSKKGMNSLPKATATSALDIPIKMLLSGEEAKPLSAVCADKKAILIVNVATKWGLTDKNYKQLVQMYKDEAAKGLQIVGAPCNQFGGQEPGTEQEINDFARGKYGAEFPMTEKIEINGANTHPLYAYLRANSSLHDAKSGKTKEVGWNFGKFLVNGEGQVVEYYPPTREPDSLLEDIRKLLLWKAWKVMFYIWKIDKVRFLL